MSGSANASSALITSDTYVGDLFTFLGSPAGRQDVTITVDNADAGEIIISTAWTAGSTFTFIAQNSGRFLGVGGAGATGGGDIGATGTSAGNGGDGGSAILNLGGYAVSIDIDDGYLYGGLPLVVLVVLVAAAVEVKALTGQATSMAARAVLVVYRLAYHHPVPALMVALQRPVLAVRVAA